jgi:Flp pilus assembly pilin Flp
MKMLQQIKRFVKDDDAPTTVEYAVLVTGVALLVIAAVVFLGGKLGETFHKVGVHVPNSP